MDTLSPQSTQPVATPSSEPQPMPESPKQEGGYYKKGSWKKWAIIYLIVGIILYGAIYYFYFYGKKSNPYSSNTSYSTPSVSPTTMQDETANWKTYSNTDAPFTMQYPLAEALKESKDTNGKIYSAMFTGNEGVIVVTWGSGFGGGCPNGLSATTVQLKNESLTSICHVKDTNGSEISTFGKNLSPSLSVQIKVSTNVPIATNTGNIIKMLSTLQFTNQTQGTDESAIKDVLAKYMKTTPDQLELTFDPKQYEQYASGGVHEKNVGGGAKWFAQKISSGWVILYVGNGIPHCSEVEKYNAPKDFLSCLN